ncbi:MAG: NADH-quinone oxidoreductase subunit C [Anaerolineales bacterium]|nr:NADH-quinone oxidoreductase subunit C [Anaerolineales bacterium]
MTHPQATIAALRERFGEAVENVSEFRGEVTVEVRRPALVEVLRFLKETPALGFTFLADLTASDDWPVEPRFSVVYQLRELTQPANLRLKVHVPGDDPVLPTVTGVHLNANWQERELWDMFGIKITGHPDLRRILMPQDWQGHPLRKDYPLGYEEVEFTFNFDEIEQKKPYAKE